MMRRTGTAALAAVWMLALCVAAPASAQVFTGRIDVSIEDPSGARLPGASVALEGAPAQTQITDAQGQAHFLNLPVGIYTIKVSLPGFTPSTSSNVEVLSGASTPLTVKLALAGAAEAVDVTPVTPVVDIRRATTTTHVTQRELQDLPSSRDPWVVMQTVPTVYMDRVNVGGAESGQQSNYNAKGAQATDNTWSIDGVPVTDSGDSIVRPEHASGASAFYYDFDSFQEMAITTGGADTSNSTSGVRLNMVLKSGANAPHGSTRYYFEDEALQDVNISPRARSVAGRHDRQGQPHRPVPRLGFELGGPLLQNVAWVWGAMAHTTIDLLTINGQADTTDFNNYAFKFDGKRTRRFEATSRSTKMPRTRSAATPARRGRRKQRGFRTGRPATTRVRATSSSARTCSHRPRPPTSMQASRSCRRVDCRPTTISTTAVWRTTRTTRSTAFVRNTMPAATAASSPASMS
jgi:hypothetical protein